MIATEPGSAFVLLAIVRVLRANVLEVEQSAHDHFAARGGLFRPG